MLANVPADWFAPHDRAAYGEYLRRRLAGGFAAEAEEARRAA